MSKTQTKDKRSKADLLKYIKALEAENSRLLSERLAATNSLENWKRIYSLTSRDDLDTQMINAFKAIMNISDKSRFKRNI